MTHAISTGLDIYSEFNYAFCAQGLCNKDKVTDKAIELYAYIELWNVRTGIDALLLTVTLEIK